jgi:hypothetical protein
MTRKMSTLRPRSVAFVSLLGAILIGGLIAGPVRAQSNNPLDILTAMVTALQTSVNALQASMNALIAPAQTNVRITPVLLASFHNVGCPVVNVSTGTRMVRIENYASAPPFIQTATLTPGSISTPTVLDTAGPVYCKFIVIDGTRTDIRAAMHIRVSGGIEPGLAIAAE